MIKNIYDPEYDLDSVNFVSLKNKTQGFVKQGNELNLENKVIKRLGKCNIHSTSRERKTCDARYYLKNQTIDLNDNQIIGVKDPSATKHALNLQC